MLESGAKAGNEQTDRNHHHTGRGCQREITAASAEQPENEQRPFPESLGKHPGGKLENRHRAVLGRTDDTDLGVTQAEHLGQGRQDDVECGAQSVLYTVDGAAGGQGESAPTERVRLHLCTAPWAVSQADSIRWPRRWT